tara:strand:+ start:216 stop:650 length:435 start_codon:yes stop_codon:yes gene_type:complete
MSDLKKVHKPQLEWRVGLKPLPNMICLVELIVITAKEFGLERAANLIPNMEKDGIVYTFLAINNLDESYFDAVNNHLAWALRLQAPETLFFSKAGTKGTQRSGLKNRWIYRVEMARRGVYVSISQDDAKERKRKTQEIRKVRRK